MKQIICALGLCLLLASCTGNTRGAAEQWQQPAEPVVAKDTTKAQDDGQIVINPVTGKLVWVVDGMAIPMH